MLRRTVAGVAIAAIFALVFELTCRVEDLVRYGTPLLSPYTSQSDLIVRDASGARGRPNGRFQKWVLNDLGTRGPAIPRHKTPGTLRVVTAGASETFGLYESNDREYPRQLEDSLRAALPGLACPDSLRYEQVQVVNPALPGMSLPTVALDLEHRIAALAPDFVAYYPTPPQYLGDEPPGVAPPLPAPTAEHDTRRALHPRSAARLRNQLKTLLPGFVQTVLRRREIEKVVSAHPPGWRYTSVPAERLNLFERDLRRLVGTVRAIRATPVLVTSTHAFLGDDQASPDMLYAWERFTPRATGAVILAFDSSARSIMRDIARDSVIALADAGGTVRGQAAFADFSHFTDAGAAAMAGLLARTIVAEVEKTGCAPGGGGVTANGTHFLRP